MPLPPLLLAGLGIQGLSAVAQGILGISQADDAEELRNRTRPEYNIENEYYDNVNTAASSAQFGLTPQSKDFYSSQADRGLNRSVDAALRSGGSINSFADLYDTYLQQNYRIAAEDSQLREAKIRNFMQTRSDLAAQKTQQWAINELEPYKDSQQAAAAAEASSTKNLFGAASTVASGLATAATAGTYDKLLNPAPVAATVPLVSPAPVAPAAAASLEQSVYNPNTINPAPVSTPDNMILYEEPEPWISDALKNLRTKQLGISKYITA